jgi:hypothetical protein
VEEMDRLTPTVFKNMFRVDRPTFDEVLDSISPFISARDEQKAINSSGSVITMKTRLAVTLCWLAGGSYLDLCFAWGVSSSTFYHPEGIIWPVLEAIDAAFTIGFPFKDDVALEDLSNGFSEHSGEKQVVAQRHQWESNRFLEGET